MKRLILSTILITSSFFTFANEHVFTSEQWKEIKTDDPKWDYLDQICTEKFPGSRPPNVADIIAFTKEFKKESQRPQLYTFLRETFGFADSSDPKIQSTFQLNDKHRTIALPFYLHDQISHYNSRTLFSIALNEDDELTAQLPLVDRTGARESLITLAPSLGEAKTFCILGNENS